MKIALRTGSMMSSSTISRVTRATASASMANDNAVIMNSHPVLIDGHVPAPEVYIMLLRRALRTWGACWTRSGPIDKPDARGCPQAQQDAFSSALLANLRGLGLDRRLTRPDLFSLATLLASVDINRHRAFPLLLPLHRASAQDCSSASAH